MVRSQLFSILLTRQVETILILSDELYGAVMNCLVASGRSDEATEMFESLGSEVGKVGIKPGLSSYNALLHSKIRAGRWVDALQVFESINNDGLVPDSLAIQGMLISGYHVGGEANVLSLLERIVTTHAKMDQRTFEITVKMLLPDIKGTTNEIRHALREIGISNPDLKAAAFNLVRAIRMAEVEQHRVASPILPWEEIVLRREKAWRSAMITLINYVKLGKTGGSEPFFSKDDHIASHREHETS